MGNKINIELIIKNVKMWVKKIQFQYNEFVNVETIMDENKVYRVILHINSYLAQIVVAEENYAPYNNIAFEIVGMENDKANMLYCWYDDKKDDISTIIEHLDIGLLMALR